MANVEIHNANVVHVTVEANAKAKIAIVDVHVANRKKERGATSASALKGHRTLGVRLCTSDIKKIQPNLRFFGGKNFVVS